MRRTALLGGIFIAMPLLAGSSASCGSSGSRASADGGADADARARFEGGIGGGDVDSGPGPYDSDVHNCGSAGHDCSLCGGVTCAGGQCKPTIVASGQSQPLGIAVDSTGVYWATTGTGSNGGIAAAYPDGGVAVLVPPPFITWGVALDATHVFFSSNGAFRVGKDGLGLTQVGPPPGENAIAVDSARVFWVDGLNDGKVQSADVGSDGGALTYVIADLQAGPVGIALDDTNAYWVNDDGSIWTATKTADDISTTHALYQPAPRAVSGGGNSIVVDASALYWCDLGVIQTMTKTGEGRRTIYPGDTAAARDIIGDETSIYFPPIGATSISRIGKDGAPPQTYDTNGTLPKFLAVDDACLYWTEGPPSGGTVERVTK